MFLGWARRQFVVGGVFVVILGFGRAQRDDLVAFGSEPLVVTFFGYDRHGSVDFGASSLSGLQQSALLYIVGSAVSEDPV